MKWKLKEIKIPLAESSVRVRKREREVKLVVVCCSKQRKFQVHFDQSPFTAQQASEQARRNVLDAFDSLTKCFLHSSICFSFACCCPNALS